MTIIAIIMAFIILLTGYTIFKKLNYRMSGRVVDRVCMLAILPIF